MKTTNSRKPMRYAIVFLVLACSGCAAWSRNYGTFVIDEAVAQRFERYQIDPDINYYFSGPESYPNVIMGLKKEYVLDNDLWKPLRPDPELFKKFVYNMGYIASDYNRSLFGFVMKSPDGRTLGVWYSPLHAKMMVRMGEGNKVVVYTPDQYMYHESGGDDFRGHRMRFIR